MKAISVILIALCVASAMASNIVRERQRESRALAAAVPVDPNADLAFAVFNNPNGNNAAKVRLTTLPADPPGSRFTQRLGFDHNNLIYCETTATVKTTVENMKNLIMGPWTWWQGGKQENRVSAADGSTDYILYPAWLGVKVHEHMHAPQKFGTGYIIRIDFLPDQGSYAQGRGYFMIVPGAVPGTVRVTGRFAGVKSLSHILTPNFFAVTHLKGERGRLFGGLLPSGWHNLVEVAEGRMKLPATYSVFSPPANVANAP